MKYSVQTTGTVKNILKWYYYVGYSFKDDRIHVHWLAKIALFCCFCTFSNLIIGITQERDDPDKVFEGFSLLSCAGIGLLKVCSLMKTRHPSWYSVLKIAKEMEEYELNYRAPPTIEYESDEENTHDPFKFSDHIKNYLTKYQKFLDFISKMYLLTIVMYTTAPFIEYALLKHKGLDAAWPHIFPGWHPFDKVYLAGYVITIAMELVAGTYCVFVHTVYDVTTVAICIFIGGQFSLLLDYSENIGGKGHECKFSSKRDDRAHYRIMLCHKMHIRINNAIDILNKILKNLLGIYFFIVTLTMCTIAVRLNAVVSTVQLLSWLQYMCTTLIQLFLFCYYGDHVLNNSSVRMGEGPYASAYWCLSPRIRKELSILAFGMSKPHQLQAGPFVFVNLNSFIQIIRAAYSYYTLIGK